MFSVEFGVTPRPAARSARNRTTSGDSAARIESSNVANDYSTGTGEGRAQVASQESPGRPIRTPLTVLSAPCACAYHRVDAGVVWRAADGTGRRHFDGRA